MMSNHSEHIHFQKFGISRADRNKQRGHQSFVVWFTGLSGSGKSTLANSLEAALHSRGISTYTLDGDNTRMGINKDLDFSDQGRKENIRRVAEIAKLMVDSGTIVISSFISPFIADRENAKSIIGAEDFIEVFVDCPLEICEQRDVKGLYAKARANLIPNFTGISSPFEAPLSPDITVQTHLMSLEDCLKKIIIAIENKLKL
jgi:adenylylsulfate kinase